ncbi:MAG TPA: hypothetical protein VGE39_25120, partial [Prosthecobacter sp.]
MRLSHFALALTLVLLAVTGYLAWEAQEEARGARKELEMVRKQQAAKDAARPIAPTTVAEIAPLEEPSPAPAPATPPLAGSGLMPGTPATPMTAGRAPLTALQKQVLGMPAQAKIIDVQKDQGFAVINAGKNNQLEKGMRYDVRRNDGLVGRVIISDAIEATEAVVDIDPTAVLPGVSIEVGDELIVPVR